MKVALWWLMERSRCFLLVQVSRLIHYILDKSLLIRRSFIARLYWILCMLRSSLVQKFTLATFLPQIKFVLKFIEMQFLNSLKWRILFYEVVPKYTNFSDFYWLFIGLITHKLSMRPYFAKVSIWTSFKNRSFIGS